MYFLTLTMLGVMPPVFYFIFRISVETWLRRKRASKGKVKKLMKGKRNYWWYEGIHRLYDMGIWYHLNKLVTITYALALGLALLFGWHRAVAPIVCGLHVLVALVLAVMTLWGRVQDHLEQHGVPVVILRRNRLKRYDSIVMDFALAAMPVAFACVHVKMAIEMLTST